MLSYQPLAPKGVVLVSKWLVANSTTNLLITQPTAATSTVAKAAATTQSVSLTTPAARFQILTCTIKSTTAFVGTTTLTATVGITGSLTGCIATPFNLLTAVSNTQFSVALPTTPVMSFNGTDSIILALTSTVQNISAISAGALEVDITWTILP